MLLGLIEIARVQLKGRVRKRFPQRRQIGCDTRGKLRGLRLEPTPGSVLLGSSAAGDIYCVSFP